MGKIPIAVRNEIVHLRKQQLSYGTIKLFLANKGIYVGRNSIKELCKKFDVLGSVVDKKIRRLSKFGDLQAHKDYINEVMSAQPDTTARDLVDGIKESFDINLSVERVCEIRKSLGWTRQSTRYCQMIREVNKLKRLNWCTEQENNWETFEVSFFH